MGKGGSAKIHGFTVLGQSGTAYWFGGSGLEGSLDHEQRFVNETAMEDSVWV